MGEWQKSTKLKRSHDLDIGEFKNMNSKYSKTIFYWTQYKVFDLDTEEFKMWDTLMKIVEIHV